MSRRTGLCSGLFPSRFQRVGSRKYSLPLAHPAQERILPPGLGHLRGGVEWRGGEGRGGEGRERGREGKGGRRGEGMGGSTLSVIVHQCAICCTDQ